MLYIYIRILYTYSVCKYICMYIIICISVGRTKFPAIKFGSTQICAMVKLYGQIIVVWSSHSGFLAMGIRNH